LVNVISDIKRIKSSISNINSNSCSRQVGDYNTD